MVLTVCAQKHYKTKAVEDHKVAEWFLCQIVCNAVERNDNNFQNCFSYTCSDKTQNVIWLSKNYVIKRKKIFFIEAEFCVDKNNYSKAHYPNLWMLPAHSAIKLCTEFKYWNERKKQQPMAFFLNEHNNNFCYVFQLHFYSKEALISVRLINFSMQHAIWMYLWQK